MTEEEKHNLLRKGLCSRFPYYVKLKVKYEDDPWTLFVMHQSEKIYVLGTKGYPIEVKLTDCQPYLRPISSITEEEVDKLFDILNLDKENETEWLKVNDINIIRLFTQEGKDFYEIAEAMDYLYSIHVDFRGLLWENLAIEVTEENNPYK